MPAKVLGIILLVVVMIIGIELYSLHTIPSKPSSATVTATGTLSSFQQENKFLPLTFTQKSTDGSLFTFIGVLNDVKKEGSSVVADITIALPSGEHKIVKFLLYPPNSLLPFSLYEQKTNQLYPASSDYSAQLLSGDDAIVSKLSPYTGTQVVVPVTLSVVLPPSPSADIQQKAKFLSQYTTCDTVFSQAVNASNLDTLSCTPYLSSLYVYKK